MPGPEQQALTFIQWKRDYDCLVDLLNFQHQDILQYLNRWYQDIRLHRIGEENPVETMRQKLGFISYISNYHLRFEEDVLTILVQRYGFPRDEYERHGRIHATFIKSSMVTFSDQVGVFVDSGNLEVLETLVVNGLADVAKWWYQHIRGPERGNPAGPDSFYRRFIANLPMKRQLALLNDLLVNIDL